MANKSGASGGLYSQSIGKMHRAALAASCHWEPSSQDLMKARKMARAGSPICEIAAALGWTTGENGSRKRLKKYHIPIIADARTETGLKLAVTADYHFTHRPKAGHTIDSRPYRP